MMRRVPAHGGGGQLPKEYIYAVTRIHTEERRLLNGQDMERLFLAQNAAECHRLLADKGWGAAGVPADDSDALLAFEEEKTWALVRELIGDLSPLEVLYRTNDFHNLKAAIKLVYSGQERENAQRCFLEPGAVSAEVVLQAARRNDFSELPPDLAEAGREAYDVLIHTADGQACEMVLDTAALVALDAAGRESAAPLLRFCAALRADEANIKAAARACRMGKGRDFLARAVAPSGSLDTQALIDAAAKSFDEICAYLSGTEYAGAVETLRDSLSAFECWCDNRLMESIRPQRYEYFTIEPLAAYILARENEIAMVRMLLTAKLNRLDGALVRKRWRQTYV